MIRFFSLLCLAWGLVVLFHGRAFAETCSVTSCHRPIISAEKPHAPVKEKDCVACHNKKNTVHPLLGGKSWELVAKVPQLCEQCHDPFGKKKVMHPPVKEGECLACHKPHGGAGRFLLDVSDDQTELCLGCHDSAPFKQRVKHGPVAVGACTKCHNPHESDNKSLLGGQVRDVCLKCHVDFLKTLNESVIVHSPVKNGPCTTCHNPHGGQFDMLLKKNTPGLCLDCHKDMVKKLKVKVLHKPLQQEGGCSNCHSTHFSKAPKLLAGDDIVLCLVCHNSNKLGTPPLRNIKSEIEGKKYLHGPIRQGQCRSCHDPHGSDFFRMLPGNYPVTVYAQYKDGLYSACLKCHEKNLLRFADTTMYTGFRNGNRNLHYVHVVGRKGRSCRVCHEPHASNGEKLINNVGMSFGDWKIPVNFKITSSGGGCAPGCHRPLKYDRVKPENYKTEEK